MHISAHDKISFSLRLSNIPLRVYTDFCLSVYARVVTGLFPLLAIVKSAAMNTDVQISLQGPVFNSFGHLLRNWIAGSYVVLFLIV